MRRPSGFVEVDGEARLSYSKIKQPSINDHWRNVDDKKRRPRVNHPVWMCYKANKQKAHLLMCWTGDMWVPFIPHDQLPDGAVLLKYIVLPA